MTAEARRLLGILRSVRFKSRDEASVQEAIGHLLAGHQIEVQREAVLGDAGRIDFLVGRVGIEVKVGGSRIAAVSQVQRYALRDEVDEIILAATKAVVVWDLPKEIGGKPLHAIHLRSYL